MKQLKYESKDHVAGSANQQSRLISSQKAVVNNPCAIFDPTNFHLDVILVLICSFINCLYPETSRAECVNFAVSPILSAIFRLSNSHQ